jgi:hypothetical protein
MRSIIRSCAFVLIALQATCNLAHAQGSPLDLLGFGQPVITTDGHLEGLSGAGVAMTDPRLVDPLNPASLSWLSRARLESELHFDYIQSSESQFTSLHAQNLGFGGFAFGAPVSDALKLGIALGLTPLTDATANIQIGDSTQTSSYRSLGGLSEVYLGAGMSMLPGLAIGGRLDVLFGNVIHQSQIQFADPAISSGIYERDYALNGLRGTFGMNIVGDSISHFLNWLTVGITYSTPAKLTSTQRTVITPVNSLLDTTVEVGGVGAFPGSLQLGLNVHFSDRVLLVMDMMKQDYSTSYLYAPVSSLGDSTLGPSTRYAIGFERRPNLSEEYGSGGFWSKLGLRIGASYYQLPFRPAGSGGVNVVAFSGGVGIPVSAESLLDLSLTAGQRSPVNVGTTPKDLFLQFGISLSLSAERWFVPSRLPE